MKRFWPKILTFILIFTIGFAGEVKADLIGDKRLELHNLQKQIEEQEQVLKKVRDQKLTLDNQVKLLDQQIEAAQLSLGAIGVEIEAIRLEKSDLNNELIDLEIDALNQKLILQKAIRKSYVDRKEGLLEMLVGSDSLAGFMTRLEYLDRVQHHISVSLKTLNDLKQSLAAKKVVLEKQNDRLGEIMAAKVIEEQSLQIQFQAKDGILKDLKLSEADYQQRLNEARQEQEAVSNMIANLLRSSGQRITSDDMSLLWPIPYRTITASFRDPDYKRRFGLIHNAIDVAAPHGTPIKSPASGLVTKIKQGVGSGLSYLVITHDNGLATVYLHLSGFAVSTGAYVAQGQVVAYTGGTPGTQGAGWLTTGAHLHFEVWQSSQPKNPLAYLV